MLKYVLFYSGGLPRIMEIDSLYENEIMDDFRIMMSQNKPRALSENTEYSRDSNEVHIDSAQIFGTTLETILTKNYVEDKIKPKTIPQSEATV